MLREHTRANDLGKVFIAPVDVQLGEENLLQPDVLFIAENRRGITGEQKIEVAPDMVIEVLSPANRLL